MTTAKNKNNNSKRRMGFIKDIDKVADMLNLSMTEFLDAYPYLTVLDYSITKADILITLFNGSEVQEYIERIKEEKDIND